MTEIPLFLLEKSSIFVASLSCQSRSLWDPKKAIIPKYDRIYPVFTRKIIDSRRFAFVSVSEPLGSPKARNFPLFSILRPRISTKW